METLDLLIDALGAMRRRVADHDHQSLLEILGRASDARRALSERAPRPEELVEVRIPVPDRTGVLAEITVLVTELGINIVDLEIAHSVEGDRGVCWWWWTSCRHPPCWPPSAGGATGPRAPRWDRLDERSDGRSDQRHDRRPHGRPDRRHDPWAAWPDGSGVGARGQLDRYRWVALTGTIEVPGDKSISHRALLLAALAEGTSTITGLSTATTWPAPAGGGRPRGRGGPWRGRRSASTADGRACGRRRNPRPGQLGHGMRLLAGVAATLPGRTTLTGDDSLRGRPMDRVAEPLGRMGATDGRAGGAVPPAADRHRGPPAGHRLHPTDGQRPGQVGRAAGRARRRGRDRGARAGGHPGPHRGDAGRGRVPTSPSSRSGSAGWSRVRPERAAARRLHRAGRPVPGRVLGGRRG